MNFITFLGIGKMGLPMANNLANAGYKVTCWNRTPAKLKHLPPVLAGNSDLNTAISGADIVISMLRLKYGSKWLQCCRKKQLNRPLI